MTAEVAILNRQGIALAADSAVTIGQQRVWKTTNKIFSLGPRNDMAIMVYGGADYAGLPWETLIKSFKFDYASIHFESVAQCSAAFREYLNDERWGDPLQSQLAACSVIIKEIEELSEFSYGNSASEFRNSIKSSLDEWLELIIDKEKCLPDLTKKEFLEKFGAQIKSVREEKFTRHFPKYLQDLLEDYIFEYFTREQCSTDYQSGVVICGYGRDEYFPALDELIVDGRYEGTCRSWFLRRSDLNSDSTRPSEIIPFAQRDMANLFMEGLSPAYSGYFFSLIQDILEKKTKDILDQFNGTDDEKLVERRMQERIDLEFRQRIQRDFHAFRNERFVQPLMSNVNGLPRDEMAAMAEALVELTSLRRKIDSAVQSVAGPVDVAVISKSDGVVWIKRKHYFDADQNREFVDRKSLLECPDE